LETAAVALTSVTMLAAIVVAYRRQRYWERHARMWQDRLKAQLGVLRTLIRDARETQQSYRGTTSPAESHADFIVRCETALRDHFGTGYVARVERRMSEDLFQPPGLTSDEHIFAWYDTERRIAALHELVQETADDLASFSAT
jgi:hypothetical protein